MKESTYDQFSLEDELLSECEAMAKYAFKSGMKVSGAVVQKLDVLSDQLQVRKKVAQESTAVPAPEEQENADEAAPKNEAGNIARDLAVVHGSLVGIVAPATPRNTLTSCQGGGQRERLAISWTGAAHSAIYIGGNPISHCVGSYQ